MTEIKKLTESLNKKYRMTEAVPPAKYHYDADPRETMPVMSDWEANLSEEDRDKWYDIDTNLFDALLSLVAFYMKVDNQTAEEAKQDAVRYAEMIIMNEISD